MNKTSEEIIDSQLTAYRARDIDTFVGFYHDEIQVYKNIDGAPLLTGIESLREVFARIFEQSPNLQCTVKNRMTLGNYVIDHEHVTGARGSDQPLNALLIYQIESGKIRRMWSLSPFT